MSGLPQCRVPLCDVLSCADLVFRDVEQFSKDFPYVCLPLLLLGSGSRGSHLSARANWEHKVVRLERSGIERRNHSTIGEWLRRLW